MRKIFVFQSETAARNPLRYICPAAQIIFQIPAHFLFGALAGGRNFFGKLRKVSIFGDKTSSEKEFSEAARGVGR